MEQRWKPLADGCNAAGHPIPIILQDHIRKLTFIGSDLKKGRRTEEGGGPAPSQCPECDPQALARRLGQGTDQVVGATGRDHRELKPRASPCPPVTGGARHSRRVGRTGDGLGCSALAWAQHLVRFTRCSPGQAPPAAGCPAAKHPQPGADRVSLHGEGSVGTAWGGSGELGRAGSLRCHSQAAWCRLQGCIQMFPAQELAPTGSDAPGREAR